MQKSVFEIEPKTPIPLSLTHLIEEMDARVQKMIGEEQPLARLTWSIKKPKPLNFEVSVVQEVEDEGKWVGGKLVNFRMTDASEGRAYRFLTQFAGRTTYHLDLAEHIATIFAEK